VAGIAISETVSWGILYYAFPVLLPAMERDLGWSRPTLVGAFTVAIIVSGFGALPVGRLLDRHPARPLMTAGSVLGVVAVVAWASSTNAAMFYGAWLAVGVAMALVLYEPAQVVLVKRFGGRATKAITAMTLVAGFASTIFQPITAVLADRFDWRTALLVLAGVLAAITIPLHLSVLPRRSAPSAPHRAVPGSDAASATNVAAMRLLTVAFTLAAAAKAACIVHLVPYLVDNGWSPVVAAVAAGTLGATQVAARVAFGPTARRTPAPTLAAVILGLPALGAVILAVSGAGSAAWVAVLVFGAAQGTATLLRPMLLSALHGPAGYGRLASTSAATTTVARAVAPLLMAVVAARAGYEVGFLVSGTLAVAAAAVAHRAVSATPVLDAHRANTPRISPAHP
jgi:predicted MFS family arabinose efflux permease